MPATTQATTHHEVIQLWAEDRGGVPASVKDTSSAEDVGILRIWFPGQGSGDDLDEISWEEFFSKFEEAELAFLYETTGSDGTLSHFCKLISRHQ